MGRMEKNRDTGITLDQARDLVSQVKALTPVNHHAKFDWELTDKDQGYFDLETVVFLWFKDGITLRDRRMAQMDIYRALQSTPVEVRGVKVRSLWLFPDTVLTWNFFNEEVMKPERFTEAPDYAGLHPDTMKVSKWYLKTTLNRDVSHFSFLSRTSDTFVETNLTSDREPIEDFEERLAMKIGDMPPPLPRRVSNPRIRGDEALNEFFSNSDKMIRATSDDVYTEAWFDYSRSSLFPQSVGNILQCVCG